MKNTVETFPKCANCIFYILGGDGYMHCERQEDLDGKCPKDVWKEAIKKELREEPPLIWIKGVAYVKVKEILGKRE